jgi:hypothetical protein
MICAVEGDTATIFVDLFGLALDVDWSTEGDELLHHMWLALDRRVPMTGHRYWLHQSTESEPHVYHRYKPTSDVLTSELALVPRPDGKMRAFVGITGQRS